MILVVPRGAQDYPISHGTTDYRPFRADHTDPHSLWLVDVPPEVAVHLVHNGGFYPMSETVIFQSPHPLVPLRHSDGAPRPVSWGGFSFEPDERGINPTFARFPAVSRAGLRL
jgi:hypothetical protein